VGRTGIREKRAGVTASSGKKDSEQRGEEDRGRRESVWTRKEKIVSAPSVYDANYAIKEPRALTRGEK